MKKEQLNKKEIEKLKKAKLKEGREGLSKRKAMIDNGICVNK